VKVGTLNTHGVCTISLQAAVHTLTGPHTNKQTIYPTMHTVLHRNFPFNPEVLDYDFNIGKGKGQGQGQGKVKGSVYPRTGHEGPEGE
jgi:hypothetical protein